jgi:hypothetical protein
MVTITFPFLFERELNGSIFSRYRRMMEPVFLLCRMTPSYPAILAFTAPQAML